MKQARIALGVILVAGMLAVLLSWPEKVKRGSITKRVSG